MNLGQGFYTQPLGQGPREWGPRQLYPLLSIRVPYIYTGNKPCLGLSVDSRERKVCRAVAGRLAHSRCSPHGSCCHDSGFTSLALL